MNYLHITLFALFGFSILCVSGQDYEFNTRLTAFDQEAAENFGWDVDIHDDLLIVGSPNDGVSTATNGGSAYIYQKTGDDWLFMDKIRSNDSIMNINFGTSVAISADFAVVGDPDENMDGAAYIFERNGSSWTQINKLEASVPSMNDQYGFSVDIDGDWIFVGAPKEEENAAEMDNVSWAGSIFLYSYDGSDWDFDSKMIPADRLDPEASNQQFGYAIAADNGRLIAGANQRVDGVTPNVGAAYFFEFENGSWVEKVMMRPADGFAADRFGSAVDLKASTAVVGAMDHDYDALVADFKGESGAAYYYNFDSTAWVYGGKLVWSDRDNGDNFGSSVSISPDGERIVVGMYRDVTRLEFDGDVFTKSECGAAVVYTKNILGEFLETQRILPSILATGDYFGNAMAATNTDLVVGVYLDDIETNPNSGLCNLDDLSDNGAVDVFKFEATNPTSIQTTASDLNFRVYPNPCVNEIMIEFEGEIMEWRITNVLGQIMDRQVHPVSNRVNLANLNPGVYFISINNEHTTQLVKR